MKLLKPQEIQIQEKENISSNLFLKALASVLSVAAQMKEAMLDLEEGSARSQVGLCLNCLCLCFHLVFGFVLIPWSDISLTTMLMLTPKMCRSPVNWM